MKRMKTSAEEYLRQEYPVLLWRIGPHEPFVAEVPDWPGCMAHGATPTSALRSLRQAQVTWVDDCLERGLSIPPPRPPEEASGKLVLRLPRSLHRRLGLLAAAEGVSLNTLLVTMLAEGLGLSAEGSPGAVPPIKAAGRRSNASARR